MSDNRPSQSSWLARLGFGSRAARKRRPARPLAVENLERRELLDGHGISDPPAPAPFELPMRIGTNPEGVYDWSGSWMFTDIFKHSRDWIAHEINTATGEFTWQGQSAVQTDANGWPVQLDQWTNANNEVVRQALGTLMFHDIDGHYPAGIYRAEWDGTGNIASGAVEFDSDNIAVVSHGLTAAGRNYADLQVTPDDFGIYLRINQLDTADPIRNINVWMPDYQGQTFAGQNWAPGDSQSPFHPLFVDRISPFKTLRFMQMGGANDTTAENWSDRRQLQHARQTQSGSIAAGAAIEYQVALANEIGADAWFNMPHAANDDYVRNFAIQVRDTLLPSSRVYVEWSNEPSNARPEYPAYHWVTQQLALPENAGRDRWEFVAAESDRDMNIWSEVFAGQEHRLVRVIGGFTHDPFVAQSVMSYAQAVDALAIGLYAAPDEEERGGYDGNTTWQTVIGDTIEATATTLGFAAEHRELLEQQELLRGRDLEFLAYESGPHLDVDRSPIPEVFAQAYASDGIYDIEELLINGAFDLEFDLLNDFQHTERFNDGVGAHAFQGGNFGSLMYQDQPASEAHKYRALVDALMGANVALNNDRPTVSSINDVIMPAGSSLQVNFQVSDTETPADDLVIVVDSSESGLIPNSNLQVSGSGGQRTLTITTENVSIPEAMISVLVIDNLGGTVVETFDLTIGTPPSANTPLANTPPTALDATRSTLEDNEVWVELWQIADDAETPFEQLTFAFSNVQGGSVAQLDAWSAIFTPDANHDGAAGFDFTVTDGGSPPLSATAHVEIDITPVNDYPTAGSLHVTTQEDTPVEFSLAGVISDIETATPQLTVNFPNVWGGVLEQTSAVHGYRFIPEQNETGTVELWYEVVDEGGLDEWGSVTIEILAVNDAPLALDASFTTPHGTPLYINLWELASDAETAFEDLVFVFSNVVGGTLQRLDTYTAVFTPLGDFSGQAGFDFTVFDDDANPLSDSASVAITVLPEA